MTNNSFNIVGNLLLKVDDAEAGLNKLKNSLSQLKLPANLDANLKKSFSNLDGLFAKYRAQLKEGFNTKSDITSFNKTGRQIEAEYDRISASITKLTGKEISFKMDLTAIHNAEKELEKLIGQKEKLIESAKGGLDLNDLLGDIRKVSGGSRTHAYNKSNILETSLGRGDLQKAKSDVTELINALNNMSATKQQALESKTGMSMAQIIDKIKTSVDNADAALNKYNADIKVASDTAANIKSDQFERATVALTKAAGGADKLTSEFKELNGTAQQSAESMFSMTKQVQDLQQSTQYFFSLRNMISLLRRGIDDAIQSVKELDKAMTDTAVVTDFSVGDMWKDLPKYTQLANELGATTKGAYETMTLYYQQGLDQQQAFALGAETMKMARIAGLDYAETTDMMTAALRGFNMELDETSAKRVNDVYSKLAAITASDTEELGTAMQRTASIAASAGASFEGTTAFLAQAIETTREPAENIGTAMKTIVARFQEMKKNPLEISEVDGEEVDYNKIDAALKTIGVDLKDTNGQFRDFDQVMLDISAKWDTLSQSQQRYIATTAAGSRQQSRFIAMVSDYDRTMQLMEAANNSAGASEEQFGKTAESLEFKLNKLHNAWELFTMGIANNSIIKGAVDGITTLLTGINNLIDGLSLGIGPVKSFLSLLTAFTGLKAGGRLVNSLIGGLGGLIDPQSSVKEGFKTGFFGGGKSQLEADKISNPIVKAIYNLIPHIDGSVAANTEQPYKFTEAGSYNKARKELIKESGRLGGKGYTVGQLTDIINNNQLNKEQQKNFFQSSPGLKKNLINSLSQLYSDISMDPKVSKGLIEGFKQGDLALDEVLDVSKLQTSLSDKVAQVTKESGWAAGQQLQNKYWQQYYNEAIEQGIVDSDKINSYINQKMESTKIPIEPEQLEQFYGKLRQLTPLQKFSNTIGQVGAGLSSAGMAMQQFGAQISNVSPVLGAFVSQMGSALTMAGSFASAIPALLADPLVAAITAAVAAGAAIVLGAKAYTDNIKKRGEEVIQTYKDASSELKDSISQIESYQSELTRLSAGVDENGLNVSLDTSEYERYKEIVNDLIQQNPEIIKGWNSEGQAIIDVNSALKDTIALKREALQKEKDTYLSDISGQQLINARNATAGYVDTRDRGPYDQSDFLKNAKKVGESISKSSVADAAIAAGFDLEKIKQGDTQAIHFLQEHYSLLESIYKQGREEISSDLSNQIGKLSDGLKAYDEAVAPLVDYLTEYATEQNLFADLPVELTSAFNEGIKSIAGKNLDISEMKGLTNLLSLQLRDAFDEAKPLLDEADAALDTFTQDLNDAAYNEEAGRIAQQLRGMADEAEALGHTEVAQWYENQASRVEKAISNATESIADNIDTLADNVANAKTNFEALGESIDDYYTLADQAHGLVETALEEKNTEGKGSKTFWNTYRGLASEDAYNEHDIDKAISNMKQFQKYFTEGAEGSRAFAQKLIDSQDDIIKGEGDLAGKHVSDFFKLAEDGTMSVTDAFTNLTDEQYAQLASVFDLSADGFTAVLNKLRQFGDLDFTDPAGVRRALALDDRSVKTTADVAGQEGVKRLYYGQSVLDAETADLEPEIKEGLVKDLTVQGSIQLPTGAENLLAAKTEGGKEGSLLAQFVKDTQGSNNQVENVMKALIQSGEYNKDELQTIHGELTKEGGLLAGADDSNKHFDDLYNGITESLEDPTGAETNNILGGIDATVDTIAGILAAGKVKEGYLPDVAKQSAQLQKDLIGETGVVDSWAQLFARGKDEKGNVITDDAKYRELDAKLAEVQTANNNYIKELEAGKQAAIDRGATQSEIDAFDAEITAAKDNAALIELYLANAATNYDNIVKETEKASGTLLSQLQTTSEQNLSKNEQQAEVTNALQTFASNLQNLGFNAEQIAGIFKDNFGIELELKNGEFATDVGNQIQEQVSGKDFDINAVLNISSINLAGGAAAKGKNNTPSAIRRVGTMACGSKKHGYTISGEPTLTGELGPELVWEPRQNTAYMVGEHGPQFANLSKNAVVWNAQQTKKIQKNSKGVSRLGTGARGIHSFGTMGLGNMFGGGGGTTIPGVLNLNANATILDVIPPTSEPEIPVKAKLEVEGNSGGSFLNKIFGGGKGGPSINVAANITSIKTGEQLQTIPVIGNITQLNTATTANNINATATVTQVTKSAQVAGEPIQVKAIATTTKVENKTSKQAPAKVSAGTQTMNVTANTSAAQAKINQLINLFNKTYTLKYKASGPSSIKVPISADFRGSWRKTVEISKGSGANGINNRGFGSLARGSGHGTVGPNNRGGLTLTGEKGFEIAWLPSENRSMILGANGPQMLNLPKDAVVFTNKQSKKILNQKAIPAGSHAGTTAHGSNIFAYLGGTGGKTSSSIAQSVKKTSNSVKKSASDAAAAVKKVSVWWENIARKTELAQRIQDKNQKAFEKYLKEMRATLRTTGESLKSGGGGGDDYLTSIGKTLGYYEAQLEKVNKELKNLDTAWAPTKQKDREKLYGQEGHENIVQVSYKSGKKTKEDLVNLAGYIKQEDGTYVVDQKALDKIANKDLRKAVADAANKEINDRLSKKYKAEDEIEKAQEAIEKMGEELYKTFFGWEVELTKIWNITQKIEQTEARISQFKGYSDLLESQLSTGMAKAGKDFAAQSLQTFQAGLQQQMRQIDLSLQSLDQKRTDLSNLISLDDEKETLTNIQNKLIENLKAQDQIATTEAQMNKAKAASDKATKDRQTVENRQKSIVTEIDKARKQTKTGSKSARKKAAQKLAQLLKEQQTLPSKLATAKNTEAAAIKAYENAKTAYENASKGATLNDTEKLGYEEYAKELEKTISTQAKAWEFMTATQMADGTVNVTFDSEAFEAEKFAGNITEEQGKAIQDYVKSIVDESKGLSQQYVDATSLINDMYGSLNTLQDSWADYADELWDISEAEQKKEVENAKKLSDSITNSLKNLLDEVKRKLDERRQQEDNAKTERDISQKQQRLAMLRADTAGGHQVEIAQLEREIAEAQQSYQRSLEDQLLDKLQQQADLAAEQRERQIALQEATISEINNAAQVNQWMSNPEAYRAEIYEAFKAANEYDKKPEALQAQLDNKFNTLFNGLLTNQQEQALVTDEIKILEGHVEQISTQMSEFAHLSGAITTLAATITQTGNGSGTSTINKPTDLTNDQTTANRIEATVESLKPQTSVQSQDDDKMAKEKVYRTTIDAIHKAKKIDKTTLKDVLAKGTKAGYKWAQVAYDLAAGDGQGGISWAAVIKAAKKAGYKKDLVAQWSPKTGQPQKDFQNAFKKWNKYASGGLADYTGPAWLDGTPSRPELVLNKKDTQNFLALRDVLSSAMKSTSAVTNSYGGDVMYDINIHVDKIEKDYDVDRVVDKVKKEIVKGAGYRNVTQVRNFK